jgi:hypothetical protein
MGQMKDIVERLKTTASVRSWAEADEQRNEAADEIERLTEALHDEIRLRQKEADACRALIDELRIIADAKPSQWEEDVRDQFQAWAQNRARHAINRIEDARKEKP